ncbi:MAG: mandelate racemase [Planctomycetes bacterium]|nr:mandelate racemase [Planctomycetota bacterium]
MNAAISVVEVALARTPCRTRLPFRFGAVTVTAAELLTCRVRARGADGREARGWSGDLLVPRWFRKDTDQTPRQDADELVASARAAAAAFVEHTVAPVGAFVAWQEVFAARVGARPCDAPDDLVRGFGVALVERAVLDAVCRLVCLPFAVALRRDAFGFVPGRVHGELRDWRWQQDLREPSPRLAVRHTIGMLDVLRARELPPERRVDDGLPQTLDQDLTAYGLRHFKIKIGAGHDADVRRLLDLATFFAEHDLAPLLTLDGNEQFPELTPLADVLDAVAAEPRGRELLRRVAWIEQPLPRAATFDPDRHRDLARVSRVAPLIIDEADAVPASFVRALDLGYRGVSVKNCKGVFRALGNHGLCRRGEGRFQSGEDLTNLGVLPLQQDLVTTAVLGLPHVERNGHHYCRGLDHLPAPVAAAALAAHPDLYRALDHGGVAVRITGGEMQVGSSLQAIGYGTALDDFGSGFEVVAAG